MAQTASIEVEHQSVSTVPSGSVWAAMLRGTVLETGVPALFRLVLWPLMEATGLSSLMETTGGMTTHGSQEDQLANIISAAVLVPAAAPFDLV